MILEDKRLARYCISPLVLAGLAYLALVLAVFMLIRPRLQGLLVQFGMQETWTGPLATVLVVAGLVLASNLLFLTLATSISSMFWDRLSMEIEQAVGADSPVPTLPLKVVLLDIMCRVVFAFFILTLGFCGNFCVPFVFAIAGAGLLACLDFSASPFLRRRIPWWQQWRYLRQLKGGLTFGLVAGACSLLPMLNVLLMPVFVVGATLMFHESGLGTRLDPLKNVE